MIVNKKIRFGTMVADTSCKLAPAGDDPKNSYMIKQGYHRYGK